MTQPLAYPPFLGPEAVIPDLEPAAVLFPVPYDATSTYKKGADRGPAALLEASAAVELYDIETDSEAWRLGLRTEGPILHEGEPIGMSEKVKAAVAEALAAGRLPIVLGGEHSVSIGAIQAAAAHAGDGFGTLQIDAHGDLRNEYHGSTHNHACVMARAREVGAITQVGIRAIDIAETETIDPDAIFYAHEIVGCTRRERADWMSLVVETLPAKVYLTIDLDAFDPSLLPGTGTPEPGGLSWTDVNELVRLVAREREVVGFDVVELLPSAGDHVSPFTAAKLVYRVVSEIFAGRRG